MITFITTNNYLGVTTSGRAFRYIFFAEKAKKDAASIPNALATYKKHNS